MSHDHYIVDMYGFEVTCQEELTTPSSILLMLNCAIGENNEKRLNEIESKSCRNCIKKVYKEIISLDKKIFTIMKDQVLGTGPMAIGWSNVTEVNKMDKLEKIFLDAGFIVKQLDRARFITYG